MYKTIKNVVSGIAIAALAAVTGACSTRDPSVFQNEANTIAAGNWRIERTPDRITGVPVPSAQLATLKASNSIVPDPKPASIQLTCFEGKPIVRFAFDFKIGSDANSILGYRFDDKPGHDSVPSRILLGYTIIVIEDGAAVAQFTQELASSKSLVVRIRSLNAGRTVADFETDGGKAAIDAVFAKCPAAAGPMRDKRAKS
ncbi:MAG: hypothetical protein EKK36_12655 [Bradyrhizobiaceae bacterium]|nr:MAG: hypothetical protein EKK36_12655 [Bradyrhizobiaceae bacterium]